MIDCREQALKLLSFKDRTEKELRDRLRDKGYSEGEIEETIEFLKEYKYIDDALYARRFAADSVKLKGHGPGRIRTELLRRGIDRDTIEIVLEEMETDPREQIETTMERRFSSADLGNPKERNRIFGYFARRGYSPRDIWGVINSRCAFRDVDTDFEE